MFARRLRLLALAAAVALALVISNARAAGGGPELRYVVEPGDTLWSIAAERYEGDPREGVWRLQERNGLADARLIPGMVLVVPP